MEAVWGGVVAVLFVVATVWGYGTGSPPEPDKNKSEQSDKKNDDKKNNDEQNGNKSGGGSVKKTNGKSKPGTKSGTRSKDTRAEIEFCIRDCREAWRVGQ